MRPKSAPVCRIDANTANLAAASKRKLMKPGPAISALINQSAFGKAAINASASARGLIPFGFANTMATLVAKSPCSLSRGNSILMAAVSMLVKLP